MVPAFDRPTQVTPWCAAPELPVDGHDAVAGREWIADSSAEFLHWRIHGCSHFALTYRLPPPVAAGQGHVLDTAVGAPQCDVDESVVTKRVVAQAPRIHRKL